MNPWRAPTFTLALSLLALAPARGQVNVLTVHNDNFRTGLNTNETILTPTTVSSNGFGKLFTRNVDGPIYAQPLYVSNLPIPGKGVHNTVFVATMHDSVYAFDADSASGSNVPPLWHRSFINPAAGVFAPITTDATDFPFQDCHTFGPGEIGIVGTPVIDVTNQTIYVVARTKEQLPPPNSQTYTQYHRLHALDITTGNERPNSPIIITGAVAGTGVGSSGGVIPFDQKKHIQRPGLLLVNGIVYISFCSYCDLDPYHGWIMGYNAQTLQQVAIYNVTPYGTRGGIWMGGAGLAADAEGSIYCITGNGTFDTTPGPQNFGDTFLKLIQTTNLVVADYFTPYDQATMDSLDEDLGSSGAMLLPDSAGSQAHPHLLVGCSKLGRMYLIDRDEMGHFNPLNNGQIVQEVVFYSLRPSSPHFFGAPAFFNNRIYVQGVGEFLKAFAISNGVINPAPVSQNSDIVSVRGATPSISANGTNSGIVWEMVVNPGLRAYNAENLSQKLYDSFVNTQAGMPDSIPSYVKFEIPTVANGKVYVSSGDSLTVFGLRSIIKSITRMPAGTVRIVFTAPVGIPTSVQVSPDLVNWTNLGPGTPTGNGIFSFEVSLEEGASRFFRVR